MGLGDEAIEVSQIFLPTNLWLDHILDLPAAQFLYSIYYLYIENAMPCKDKMQLLTKVLKYDGSIFTFTAIIDFLPALLLPPCFHFSLSFFFFFFFPLLLYTVHVFGTLKMVSIYFSLMGERKIYYSCNS